MKKEKKTVYIHLKVTPTEKKQIQENADKLGLAMSSYIRLKCLNSTETTQN